MPRDGDSLPLGVPGGRPRAERLRGVQQACAAEICELQPAVVGDEQVGRLDILCGSARVSGQASAEGGPRARCSTPRWWHASTAQSRSLNSVRVAASESVCVRRSCGGVTAGRQSPVAAPRSRLCQVRLHPLELEHLAPSLPPRAQELHAALAAGEEREEGSLSADLLPHPALRPSRLRRWSAVPAHQRRRAHHLLLGSSWVSARAAAPARRIGCDGADAPSERLADRTRPLTYSPPRSCLGASHRARISACD